MYKAIQRALSWLLHKLLNRRRWRFLWQRWTRGWDDSETWSLDHSLAKVILPRLRRFREIFCDRHIEATDEDVQRWRAELLVMERAFELVAERPWMLDPEEEKEVEKGLRLFADNYLSLWW